MAATSLCWVPTWNPAAVGTGIEHLLLQRDSADSVLIAVDEDGQPFRLAYRLRWDDQGCLLQAELQCRKGEQARLLSLRVDGGRWTDAGGKPLAQLDGCIDIDIWPTPFTNSFPLWRSALRIGERREFRMAWVAAPELTVEARPQAYTRLAERRYRFESLDGTGFEVELEVDDAGLVLDYPGLFCRVAA